MVRGRSLWPGLRVILMLGLVLLLAACGDATTTTAPAAATTGISTTAASSNGNSMGGMAMTTAAIGSMPGMTMGAGQTMPAGSMMTTSAAGTGTSASGSSSGGMMMTADPMTESLKGLSGKEFEVKFMQDMIAHHQQAVQMAQLIPTHTKRPELVKLGQDIVTSQTKEISDMTGWLANWYNEKPLADSMSAPGMMEMMGDMSKLQNAKDADFDKLFVSMMIPHHQGAVNMANLLPAKTQRPELLTLGQNIIKAQTAEISQMQGWLKAWFGTGA